MVPAYIYYDSEYARNLATVPSQNVELANKVADLVDQVRLHRPLWFRHVKGHSNDVGNDFDDFCAGEGAKGFSSPKWERCSATPAAWVEIQNRDPVWLKCVVSVGGILTRRWLGALMKVNVKLLA